MATLPEGVGLDTSLTYVDRPTNTFMIDWPSRQISGMGSGLAAMRQAVDIILKCVFDVSTIFGPVQAEVTV